MREAEDFLAETDTLFRLIGDLPETDLRRPTQFKGWTVDDVIGHLHLFNRAAELAATDREAFDKLVEPVVKSIARGDSMLEPQWVWLEGLSGRALVDAWRKGAGELAEIYGSIDPKVRVKWVGPEMSARTAITARQMETWAHGHEVFDLLGARRVEQDRIRNIVVLGVNTFGWSFANRGVPVPENPPYLELTSPSGEYWTWNEENGDGSIMGSAVEFAQIVTQVRNIADTNLVVTGDTARRWMEIAQCFAGAPVDPPAPGTRFLQPTG